MWYKNILNFLNQPLNLSHNSSHQTVALILLTIAWVALYGLVNVTYVSKVLPKKKLIDSKNRTISIIHGIGSFFCGSYSFFLYPSWNSPNTQFHAFVCLFSLSYCIYDLLACIYYRIADSGLIIHHLLCVVAFGSCVMIGYGGTASMGGLFVAQISNFPMHLRCFLRNYSLRYTKMYETCQNAYLILYMLSRGIFCPIYVFWPCILSETTPLLTTLMCAALTLQSYHYIIKMVAILKKKKKQYEEMSEKGIEYNWFEEKESLKELSFYKTSKGPHIF